MGVAVQQHIMQTIDWSKHSLEGWLKQFGLWCGQGDNSSCMIIKDPLTKRISQKERERLIAEYMTDGNVVRHQFKKTHSCLIDDNEARAVQHLILDMQGKSDALDEWLDAIIARYFYSKSWADMVVKEMNPVGDMIVIYTQMDARFDVKCGLAALHCKYPFIRF